MTRSYLHAAISPIAERPSGASARRDMRPLPRFPVVDSVGGEGASTCSPRASACPRRGRRWRPTLRARRRLGALGRPHLLRHVRRAPARGGLRLVHEDGRLLLRDTAGAERAAADQPERPRRLSVARPSRRALRELLAPARRGAGADCRRADAQPPASTCASSTTRPRPSCDSRLEEPASRGPARPRVALRPRVARRPGARLRQARWTRAQRTLEGRARPRGGGRAAATTRRSRPPAARPAGCRPKLALALRPRERADRAAAVPSSRTWSA